MRSTNFNSNKHAKLLPHNILYKFTSIFLSFHFRYDINGLRSSVLLSDDCDPDVLGCSVAELSPISAKELFDPLDILWRPSDGRPPLAGRLLISSSSKFTWPGIEAVEPREAVNMSETEIMNKFDKLLLP